MDEKKLITQAKAFRELVIKEHIATLEANLVQTEASKLHNAARDLQHEVMNFGCALSNIATEGIPDTFNLRIGGDNEEVKAKIAELEAMRSGPKLTIQFDAAAMIKDLDEAGKRLQNIEAVDGKKELVISKEPNLLENPDMSPWASSIE